MVTPKTILRWTAAIAALTPGCMIDTWQFDECVRDPEICSTGYEGWQTISGCALSDPLKIQVGQGQYSFQSLEAGAAFDLHSGSGGQIVSNHIYAALRIANPDPAHRRFRVVFTLVSPGFCASEACEDYLTDRVAIIGKTMVVEASGAVSKAGFQLMSNGAPRRLTIAVEDECGRKGSAEHIVKQ
jgi:hypothetical protein